MIRKWEQWVMDLVIGMVAIGAIAWGSRSGTPLPFGLGVTLMLGIGVRFLVKFVTIPCPPRCKPEVWQALTEVSRRKRGVWVLGLFERIFFFGSIWVDAPLLAGAWLAFKVASKWAVWQHIIKLPAEVGDSVQEFPIRNAWGTDVLSRFFVGTLANLICAMAGLGAAALVEHR